MRDILITIRDDRCMDCIPQPLVEGENNTTQIVVTAPASWDGFLLRCLLTTPKGVLVDAVDALPSVPLINTMLDGPGVLKVEFIAMKGGTEVDRTLYPAILPVNAARNPLGEIPPEPLPDFLAEITTAITSANSASAAAISSAGAADQAAESADTAAGLANQGYNAAMGAASNANAAAYSANNAGDQARGATTLANAAAGLANNNAQRAETAAISCESLLGSLETIDDILAELVGDI